MLKCSKIVISILPPCFSRLCFYRGLSTAFLSASAMCSSPLQKRFFPDSPAYFDTISRHKLQVISYPTPVLLQTPSSPVLHGKQFGLVQFLLLLAPGTEVPKICPNCFPPLSCMLIRSTVISSDHGLFRLVSELNDACIRHYWLSFPKVTLTTLFMPILLSSSSLLLRIMALQQLFSHHPISQWNRVLGQYWPV